MTMNLASVAGEAGTNMLFVNFNQDCSSLAVGTKSGYRLFSLNSVEKLDQIYESEGEDICIVERLFSSSLVAVVSLSAPRYSALSRLTLSIGSSVHPALVVRRATYHVYLFSIVLA